MAQGEGGGRPTKYKAEFVKIAEKMCQLGATDMELADAFDINVATLYRWRNKHPKFCEALKVGKQPANDRVEMALYQRAIGYSHPDVHISNFQGEVTITPITKHYPPDVKAALAWVYNRIPDKWHPQPEPSDADDIPASQTVKIVVEDARVSAKGE